MEQLRISRQPPPEPGFISLADILAVLKRNLKLIALTFLACCLLGFALLVLLPKKYEASALVLIDPRRIDALADKASLDARLLTADSLVVDSEIEIARSRQLLKRVAEKSGILIDPEYIEPGVIQKVIRPVRQFISSFWPLETEQLAQDGLKVGRILNRFGDNVKVMRVGQTYVIDISYRSGSPLRAADIANAIAAEYLTDSLEAQLVATRQSSQWLSESLTKLQERVLAADRAVEAYKKDNDLIALEAGGFVNDQQLAEANARLVAAKAVTSEAKGKFDAIEKALASGGGILLPTSEAVGGNSLISQLRGDLAIVERRAKEVELKYGRNHRTYKIASEEAASIRQQVKAELNRIREGMRTEYEAAQLQEASLIKQLDDLKAKAIAGSGTEVGLRELERQAESARGLYQNLLDSFNKETQRQSAPVINARIIQAAEPPADWTRPSKLLLAALSMFFGLTGGTGLAFLREGLRKTAVSSEDLETITGRMNLGFMPQLAQLKAAISKGKATRRAARVEADGSKALRPSRVKAFQDVIATDFGPAAEVLRSIQVAVHNAQSRAGAQIVAFASALPDEGKSTVSALYAMHLARNGVRTLLVDWDFRRATLTESLTEGRRRIAQDPAEDGMLHDVYSDSTTGLHFLPAAGGDKARKEISALYRGNAVQFLDEARRAYDCVVIDLPPLAQISDNRLIAGFVDAAVLVVAWNDTPAAAVRRALAQAPEFHQKMAGTVFNKVNAKKLKSYENYDVYYA